MASRILIIDDEESMHEILSAVLKSMGHEVASALDALQGTARAQQLWPELIILDFEMPGGGGDAVFQRLRANERLSSVPVLFLSSLPLGSQVLKVPVSRNVRFMKKPVDLPELQRLVTELLAPPKHA